VKKLINRPEDVIRETLEGMALAHADLLRVDPEQQLIVRKGAPISGKVGIVSGGGSGHEPLHGGFVGKGMLDAACPGAVFTSPVPDQMLAAAKAVNSGAGVLYIVKNYTGDVMNFELAAELAEAEGIDVRSVIINDDVAVEDSTFTAGRRGVGGTVLAEKITGALAERKASLDEIAAICQKVNENVRSMGMALTPCMVPAAGQPSFELGENEMEIGIGIHGEPGRRRVPLASADEIAEMLVTPIVEDLSFRKDDRVLAFVNGMGGTPLMELYIMFRAVHRLLAERGIPVVRSLVGNYITSLEMAGTSVSLLRLDDQMIDLWDAPVHAAGMHWGA